MRNATLLALRLALIFLVFGVLWVFLSNAFLVTHSPDTSTLARYHTYIEWFYVLVVTLAVYYLTKRTLRRQESIAEELREREERLKLFIEHAPVALAMFDREMRYIAVSRRWMVDYGLDDREITALSHYEIFPEIPDRWKQLHRRGLEGEVLKAEEDRFERQDGTIQWLRWEIRPWHAHGGEIGGIVIFTEDITERKSTKEALYASDYKYRMLFENSRDALLLYSPRSKAFSSANRSALQLFGAQSASELQSLAPWHISPEFQPDGTPSVDKAKWMIAILIKEGHHVFEWTHRRLDGTIFPAEVSLSKMDVNGEALILCSLRDISDRKQLERAVTERQKIMETLQKSQVAAQTASAIAHELRQPLLAISSYSEAVQIMLKSENPNPEKIRKSVQRCSEQALRAGNSIQEMLELLSLGKFSIDDVDIRREIREALAAARSDHELRFQSDTHFEEGLPVARANRIHVQKVLLNLLNNCIEAMQDADVPLPQITIEALRSKKEDNFIHVTISDNGPGFGGENIRHIFAPFFTTKKNGIGMGLAVSRSLIEANGGQLWLDPMASTGATFHLTLPSAP